MSRLSISLLGALQLTRGGVPLGAVESDKGRALLAYLAVEADRPHSRAALAGLLWPDAPERAARQNLRQALYNLRRALDGAPGGAPALLVTPRHIQLNPTGDYWLDVSAFSGLLDACQAHAHPGLDNCPECASRLRQAVALYRGDFLAGFSLADSEAFEAWQRAKQEECHRRAMEALNCLARFYERRRDYAAAGAWAQRQLELEPWREEAHRQLMRALALSGARSVALQQYATCRRILADELGVAPDAETIALYERILAGVLQPAPVAGAPPYHGLHAFSEADAADFYGREAFVERLIQAVEHRPLVAVVGASSSGKTSVIYAGLLPRLRLTSPLWSLRATQRFGEADLTPQPPSLRGKGEPDSPILVGEGSGWLVAAFRPGADPVGALAEAAAALLGPKAGLAEARALAERLLSGELTLAGLAEHLLGQACRPGPARLLLVVDQFEELYSLCRDPVARRAFLELILPPTAAPPTPSPPAVVLLALRADFAGQALSYRPLADALQQGGLILGPLDGAELRRAIVEPARARGAAFEPGLVERLLDDVGEEPGNLPLLQFALTLLWERRAGAALTHAAYAEIGGVAGALTSYAEGVYAALSPAEQERARRILLHLVQPGQGSPDAPRRARSAELDDNDWPLVGRLADARLLVTDRDAAGQETVELVHAALLRGWGRLHGWLDADRAFRLWQGHLRAALDAWETSGRDEGELLRGAPLAKAEAWIQERAADLSPRALAFIATSLQLRNYHLARERANRPDLRLALLAALRLAAAARAEAEAAKAELEALKGQLQRLLRK